MALNLTSVPLAGVLGIAFSSMFVGGNWVITYVNVPVLVLPSSMSSADKAQKPEASPSHLARQWQMTYDIGSKAGPFLGVSSCASYLYAARELPSAAVIPKRLFVAAAVLSMAIVPFTFTVMKRTNGELHRRALAATQGKEEEAKADAEKEGVESYQTNELLRWWSTLNILRASIHVGAIGCGIAAMLL